jgi:hypothetical protein
MVDTVVAEHEQVFRRASAARPMTLSDENLDTGGATQRAGLTTVGDRLPTERVACPLNT